MYVCYLLLVVALLFFSELMASFNSEVVRSSVLISSSNTFCIGYDCRLTKCSIVLFVPRGSLLSSVLCLFSFYH